MAETNPSGLYLYAIIPTNDHIVFDVSGVDDENDAVYTIPYQDALGSVSEKPLAAVVSASSIADYRGLTRSEAATTLVIHQRVVEAVMQDYPVLPVKFGTVISNSNQVHHLLAQGDSLLSDALDKYGQMVQMEVVVLWKIQEVFQEISQVDSVIKAKAQLSSTPPEENTAGRVLLGQLVQSLLEQRRSALSSEIIAALQENALDMVANPLMDDSMVVNVALLLDPAGCEALDQKLETLDARYAGSDQKAISSLTFRRIGPLPAFSFATVDVQTISFEAVASARQCLGLGENAHANEIKRAYYKLASQYHPDHNPNLAEAEIKMTELTRAYRLLASLASNQSSVPEETFHFSQDTLSQTLLVSIQRQESTI